MKKASKVLAAAALALAFGFASCESKTAENVENTAESAADEVSETVESTTTSTDTISVKDEPVQDGVADKTENH